MARNMSSSGLSLSNVAGGAVTPSLARHTGGFAGQFAKGWQRVRRSILWTTAPVSESVTTFTPADIDSAPDSGAGTGAGAGAGAGFGGAGANGSPRAGAGASSNSPRAGGAAGAGVGVAGGSPRGASTAALYAASPLPNSEVEFGPHSSRGASVVERDTGADASKRVTRVVISPVSGTMAPIQE
jgi:hypothetical protein